MDLLPNYFALSCWQSNSSMSKSLILLPWLIVWVSKEIHAQTEDLSLVRQTITRQKIESHINFLASDLLKGRNTPSVEQLIAAHYIATQLQGYGAKPLPTLGSYFQPVHFKIRNGSEPAITFRYSNKVFKQQADILAIQANNISIQADLVFMEYGTEEEFAHTDVKNKILVTKIGIGNDAGGWQLYTEGRQKYQRAVQAGALALIELYNDPADSWEIAFFFLSSFERIALDLNGNIPHLWLKNPRWQQAAALKKNANYKAQLTISNSGFTYAQSPNVVAYVEGTDPKLKNEYVVYTAHYDHIGIGLPDAKGDSIYNGARDNATGVAMVLMAAENIAKFPVKRSALFVLFTGEEEGLLGSQWWIKKSPIPLEQIVYCLNSDNAGYNDTTKATIIGLERTTAAWLIRQACHSFGLEAIEDPIPEQNLFERSDNFSFAAVGIPAPTFSLGFTAFDEQISRYYHQPADQADNLDYHYLQKIFSAYVYAARLIANASQTPFWEEGDKYFQIGKKLYNK